MKKDFDSDDITMSDILKKSEFWVIIPIGTGVVFICLSVLWSAFQLLNGYDPSWTNIPNETGNFMAFLSFVSSIYYARKYVRDKLTGN